MSAESARRRRLPAPERKAEVVAAAYALMAEEGFAGFRTRLVAAKAGINHATVHHYFPTKADLVRAVVDRAVEQFRQPRGEQGGTGLERIVAELEDVAIRMRETPELFVVLAEISIGAARDPEIREVLRHADQQWRWWLMQLLSAGAADGSLRPDLDLDAAATTLMTLLKGVNASAGAPPDEVDRMLAQIRSQLARWLAP